MDESALLVKDAKLASMGYATRNKYFFLSTGLVGGLYPLECGHKAYSYTPHPTREFGAESTLSPDTRPHTPFKVTKRAEHGRYLFI